MITLQDQKSVQSIQELSPRVRKLRLEDNVVVVYYTFLLFLLVTVLIFLLEKISKLSPRTVLFGVNSFMLKLSILIANYVGERLGKQVVTANHENCY